MASGEPPLTLREGYFQGCEGYLRRKSKILKRWKLEWLKVKPGMENNSDLLCLSEQSYVVHRKDLPPHKDIKIKSGDRNADWICILCERSCRDQRSALEHVNSVIHKMAIKENEVNQSLSVLSIPTAEQSTLLTDFLQQVYHSHSASSSGNLATRKTIADELATLVGKQLPDASVGLHGSSASEFALLSSNVNIFVNIPEPEASTKQNPIPSTMKAIVKILKKETRIYAKVVEDYFPFNKIPRINFKHKKSKLTGEIRINVGSPTSLALLLHFYGSIDLRVHQLGVLFRYWAKVCEVDKQEDGHYPAHMFVVMVIYFLQQTQPPVVPVLHEMFPTLLHVEESAGSDTAFITEGIIKQMSEQLSSWKTLNDKSLGLLWLDLLKFYAVDFQVQKFAVSILKSELLLRENTQWGVARLAVEDPTVPRSNLARAGSSDKVFAYLWTSIKQSAVYFSHLYSESRIPVTNSITLEDDSIISVQTKPPTVQSDTGNTAPLPTTSGSSDVSRDLLLTKESLKGLVINEQSSEDTTFHTAESPSFSDRDISSSDIMQSIKSSVQHCSEQVLPEWDTVPPQETTKQSQDTGPFGSIQIQSDQTLYMEGICDTPDCGEGSDKHTTSRTETEAERAQESASNGMPNSKENVVKSTGSTSDMKERVSKKGKGHKSPGGTTDEKEQKSTSKGRSITRGKELKSSNKEDEATSSNLREESKTQEYDCDFIKEDLVFQNYVLTCLGCKRLHHNLKGCPSEKLPSWTIPKIRASPRSLDSIGSAFEELLRSVIPSKEHEGMRKQVCRRLLRHVQSVYPDANLELFGSSANGFSSFRSDLDVCLTLPQYESEIVDKANQGQVIERIGEVLKKYDDYQKISTIPLARVPIVKFYLPKYRLECDISLENRLALRNTKLIAAYAFFDPRVRLLGYAVKHFAKTCDMGDASTGSLSSYAYILMMIHYLQRTNPPVVPCLQQIPRDHKEGPWINNWNCYFCEDTKSRTMSKMWPHYGSNKESVGMLWLGFLRYYLTFDWSKQVVTIRQLEPLLKFDKWWMSKLMCIEDPFNLDHNLAASIGTRMRLYILERFHIALFEHSRDVIWKNFNFLFDSRVLVGNERPPKFFMCSICNSRGHKAAECPNNTRENRRKQFYRKGKSVVSGTKPDDTTGHSATPLPSSGPTSGHGHPPPLPPTSGHGHPSPLPPTSIHGHSPPLLPASGHGLPPALLPTPPLLTTSGHGPVPLLPTPVGTPAQVMPLPSGLTHSHSGSPQPSQQPPSNTPPRQVIQPSHSGPPQVQNFHIAQGPQPLSSQSRVHSAPSMPVVAGTHSVTQLQQSPGAAPMNYLQSLTQSPPLQHAHVQGAPPSSAVQMPAAHYPIPHYPLPSPPHSQLSPGYLYYSPPYLQSHPVSSVPVAPHARYSSPNNTPPQSSPPLASYFAYPNTPPLPQSSLPTSHTPSRPLYVQRQSSAPPFPTSSDGASRQLRFEQN